MASRDNPVSAPGPLAETLDAVHIACSQNPRGFRLHLPRKLAPPDPPAEPLVRITDEQEAAIAVELIRREALRWTYMLRSRKRWVAERRSRERNEIEARKALETIGIDAHGLKTLAASEVVVVRVPWVDQEPTHWESRIFPWEYVIAAATREERLLRSCNGCPCPLTVMRELQLQPLKPPVASAPRPDEELRALFIDCVPSELNRTWSVEEEADRLRQVLPAQWRTLSYPTHEQLVAAIRSHRPAVIHFAGLDSHQGLRELRAYFGASAEVEVRPELGERVQPASDGHTEDALDIRLVDEVVTDPQLMLDGLLLRNRDGLPMLVGAHELARLMKRAGEPAWLVSFNVWNSAARLAPLLVAEGATASAVGFQDAFDDALADYVHATLYQKILEFGWNLPVAFMQTWHVVRQLRESVDATGITLWAGAPLLPMLDAPPASRDTPSARAEIRVKVKPFPELNYAVLHNGQPLFEEFVIECDTIDEQRIVDVAVDVHMGSETATFRRQVRMAPCRIALTREIHVPLTAEVGRAVHEAINSSIAVTIREGDKPLLTNTYRLRLLPVDQWRDNRRDGRWLPSFIQPRDPAVLRAVEHAQRYNRVLRDDPNAGFDGYQVAIKDDEGSLRGVDRQVEAIWATLLHDWNLGYINPPPAYSGALDSQRLRTPSMIREHRCGTCIDLALLFASCLELIDIYPVIFLLEGHALPGWWRHPEYRHEYAMMADDALADVVDANATQNSAANAQIVSWHTGKASHDEVKRWIRQRKLVPIETVRLTENCGFIEAIEAGVSALADRRDFDSMLEVVTARYEQVTPLPILKEAP